MPLKSRPITDFKPSDQSCGIGSWRPKCLQWFATPRFFLFVFSTMGVIQGATFTYTVASLTTLEKRYAFDSKISGLILIAGEIMEMVTNPLFGHLAIRLHRPRFIGGAQIVTVLCCYLSALPYFIYGHRKAMSDQLNEFPNRTLSSYEYCDPSRETSESGDQSWSEQCESNTVMPAVVMLWLASFMNGIGFTAYFIVGVPFIDDIVKKKNSPIYLSTTAALRLLGPTLGFMLSSLCLRYYENPFIDPGLDSNRHTQWVGAWWLGFLVLGTAILILSIPMFLFPPHFKSHNSAPLDNSNQTENHEEKYNSNFWPSLKRLFRNPLWICQTLGNTTRLFGTLGYLIFKSKYMESQYGKSASSANFFSGAIGVIPAAIGLFVGGIVIRKFKPSPKPLVITLMLIEIFGYSGYFAAMFTGCPPPVLSDVSQTSGFDMNSTCNTDCKCTQQKYSPVCGPDNITNYFSPCFAKCKQSSIVRHSVKPDEFENCECMFGSAKAGLCASECNMFPIYITIFGISNIITNMARTGNTIVNLRIVDKRDKSFAFGISGLIMTVFAFIPFPITFGAVTDSACKIWEKSCGKKGNCWVYDTEKFRYYLHGTALLFLGIGTVFDIIVIFLAKRIKGLYDDKVEEVTSSGAKDNQEMSPLKVGYK